MDRTFLKDETSKKLQQLIIPGCLFLAVLAVSSQVFPYGDDFFYSAFGKHGVSYWIERNIEHYYLANGRAIVHMLASIFLNIDLWFWRVVNAVMITAVSVAAAHLASTGKERNGYTALVTASVIALVNIAITRQSIYWLDGSMNYLYPMVMLLIFWVFLNRSIYDGKKTVLLPLLAFFSAATIEHGGLMTFGLVLLTLLDAKHLKDIKLRRIHVITLICAAAGMLTVILAPAVFVRVEVTGSPVGGGILGLILYNIFHQGHELFFSRYMEVIHLIAWTAGFFSLVKSIRYLTGSKKLVGNIALFCGISAFTGYLWFMTNAAALPLDAITVKMKLLVLAVVSGYTILLFSAAYFTYILQKKANPLIALILGFGSQIMMLVSPVFGTRTLLAFIFMVMIFAADALSETAKSGSLAIAGGLCCFALDLPYFIPVSVAALLLLRITTNVRRTRIIALCAVPLVLAAGVTLGSTIAGYAKNAVVYRANLAAIEEFRSGNSEVLIQRKLPNDAYGWAMPYHNSYYEAYYNICFDVPSDTEIIWTSADK